MLKNLRTAYGAGWRAGMSAPRLIRQPNGTKHLQPCMDICPFKGRWGFLARHLWLTGWRAGTSQCLNDWLKKRRVSA